MKRASQRIIKRPYRKLGELIPNHKLLRLVTINPNGGGMEFSRTYHRRFTRPDDEWASDSYRRYKSALELEIQNYKKR